MPRPRVSTPLRRSRSNRTGTTGPALADPNPSRQDHASTTGRLLSYQDDCSSAGPSGPARVESTRATSTRLDVPAQKELLGSRLNSTTGLIVPAPPLVPPRQHDAPGLFSPGLPHSWTTRLTSSTLVMPTRLALTCPAVLPSRQSDSPCLVMSTRHA